MIIGDQIRAARGLLNWSAPDLAEKIGMRRESVLAIENGLSRPKAETLEKIVSVFEKENIEFLDDAGVRRRDDTCRVIDEGDPYLQVLDDVFLTLRKGEEVLFAFVRNALSSPAVIESDLRMRRMGIRFRSLIEEGDTYCLYPLREYRCMHSIFFQNNAQVIYRDKVASMIGGNKKAIIIHNKDYAETQRRIFSALWSYSKPPQKSTAKQTYE